MDFEKVYLAEMLNNMGVAREPETFGGGFGAEAFQSLLERGLCRAHRRAWRHRHRRDGLSAAAPVDRAMNPPVLEVTTALEQVAAAMDAEVEAVRSGQAQQLSAAIDRKRAVIEEVVPILRRSADAAASPRRRRAIGPRLRRRGGCRPQPIATPQPCKAR